MVHYFQSGCISPMDVIERQDERPAAREREICVDSLRELVFEAFAAQCRHLTGETTPSSATPSRNSR